MQESQSPSERGALGALLGAGQNQQRPVMPVRSIRVVGHEQETDSGDGQSRADGVGGEVRGPGHRVDRSENEPGHARSDEHEGHEDYDHAGQRLPTGACHQNSIPAKPRTKSGLRYVMDQSGWPGTATVRSMKTLPDWDCS